MVMPISNPIIIGWRTSTPAREAMAPVKKGNAAHPADPKLAVKPGWVLEHRLPDRRYLTAKNNVPIAPRCNSRGIT